MRSSYRVGNSIQFSICLMASDFVMASLGGMDAIKRACVVAGIVPRSWEHRRLGYG